MSPFPGESLSPGAGSWVGLEGRIGRGGYTLINWSGT